MRAWAGPPYPVARRLREGDEVAGFRVLDVPGHSPGHVAYWRESDRTLIAGDVAEQHERHDRASPGCTSRAWSSRPTRPLNRESARRLAALEPALVVFGHGPPLRDTRKFVEFASRCRADDGRARRLHRARDHGLAHGREPRARRLRADRLEPHRRDGATSGPRARRRGRRLAAGAGVEQRRRDLDGGRRPAGRVGAARRRGRRGRAPGCCASTCPRSARPRRGGSASGLAERGVSLHGRAGDGLLPEGRGRDADDHGRRRAARLRARAAAVRGDGRAGRARRRRSATGSS